MLQQQDKGVKPPDGSANPKVGKHKGGPLGGANLAATNGGTAEQQAQRCPRCDSLNTKFCYYNNYSLAQPRHFCKNCRRYWTKGGALRNVPVGGGCRKNKRLKHRDPSCLAALADIDASPSGILSSIGIPGFGPSTSSLIQELANEGHRLAFSRLGMQMLDKRFITDNDHHPQHPPTSTTQDLFTVGMPPPLLGAFDSSFPALTYSKGDSQSLLFQPHPASEFTPFFDSMNSPSSLTPTLDHLSSFTAGTPTAGHHANATPMSNTANIDAARLSLIHHMPVIGLQTTSHEEQQAMQASSAGASFNQEEESADLLSLRRSKGKSVVCTLTDWGQQLQGSANANANANANADSCFFIPPQLGATNDNGLWNASWPEMHAALAGSAGAMLH